MNTLDTLISTVSEEEFNSLFEEISDNTPNADTLHGGKAPEKKADADDKKEDTIIPDNSPEIQNINNLEDLFPDENEEDKKDEKTDKPEDKEDKGDKIEEKDENKDGVVNDVLKSTVDYLVEKGLWSDFKGRDELQVDENTYAELVAQQDEYRLKKMFDELVDSTGPYGKAIIGFVKEGGNPDEIIDIFKEQKKIENFDTSTEDGKKEIISKYYKEVIGWKPEKITRHINSLIASDELETETTEIKELYDKFAKNELKRITAEQAEYEEEQKRREDSFKQNITQAISSRKDLSSKEKKIIEDSVLTYKNRLPDGNIVSDFYLKFAQIQADPQEYIELVEYVMNKEAYLKKRDNKADNKAADKIFNFVKGNAALNPTKGSSHSAPTKTNENISTFDFGFNKK